jgi:phosphate transport system substrate-binding protein
MAYRQGRCTNFDYCSHADKRADISCRASDAFVCPECGKPLKAPPGTPQSGGGALRSIVIGAIGLLVIGGGAYTAFTLLAPAPPEHLPQPANDIHTQPAAPPSLAVAPAAPAQLETVLLRLRGSNTIGAAFAPQLAASYLSQNGDTDIRTAPLPTADEVKVTGLHNGTREAIIIAAHGSATAFSGLAAGDTDIGMASRKIKGAETDQLKTLGDMTSPANEHVLALDGIAVIVSPANPVASLTKDQLRGIFAGQIKDWAVLGGTPGPIDIYARDDKSGTYDTFKSLVLDKTPLASSTKRIEDSRELSTDVANNPRAIGFVGLPYVAASHAVAVAEAGASPLLPNRLTVATEDYPLARRLYLYTPTVSSNPAIAHFISFALSPAGQKIAEDVGFIPLTIRANAVPLPQTASYRYKALLGNAQRLSTNFRFRPNSAVLDNRGMRDLDRVVDYIVAQHGDPAKLILVGFADNQGTADANLDVSKKRADAVSQALLQRGVHVGSVAAFGADLPVADNASFDGREKNRRVEVYLAP